MPLVFLFMLNKSSSEYARWYMGWEDVQGGTQSVDASWLEVWWCSKHTERGKAQARVSCVQNKALPNETQS